MEATSGVFVAPLQVQKGSANTVVTAHDAPDMEDTRRTSLSCRNGQITPPLTPNHTQTNFERHGGFQSYIRAFYPYTPLSEENATTQILPLRNGDLILVHSVHTNGWADGTLLASGARGWLPTNYCEGYDNEQIGNLLRALTTFWDLIKSYTSSSIRPFQHSDYVRGLVAGVRCLLVSDAPERKAGGRH